MEPYICITINPSYVLIWLYDTNLTLMFHNKLLKAKFLLSAFCFLLSVAFFNSCTEEVLNVSAEESTLAPNAPNQFTSTLFPVEDGMIAFATEEDFLSALAAVAPLTTAPFSPADLNDLESRIGFKTMQGAYLELVNEYDKEEGLPGDWFAVNKSIVLPMDGGLVPTISDVSLRTILNKEGKVKVGNFISIFAQDIQVVFPANLDDEVALNKAIQHRASRMDKEIYVLADWQSVVGDSRQKSCGSGISTRNCTSPEVNDHRVRGDWGVSSVVRPEIDRFTGRITGYNVTVKYFANAKVEDRGWFNRWTRDETRLSFTCGIRATGFPGSGRGWTSSSRVHEINTSWNAAPTQFYPNIFNPDTGNTTPTAPTSGPVLDYVTGGVDDEEIPSLFCFGCCPWDCSDVDQDNIP